MSSLLPLAVLAFLALPMTAEKPDSKPVTYCSAGLAYRQHVVLANLSTDSPVPGGRPVVCSTLTKPFIHCGAQRVRRDYAAVTMADSGGQHTLYDGTAHSSVNLT